MSTPAAATPKADTKPEPKKRSPYVVFGSNGDGNWTALTESQAAINGQDAIKRYVGANHVEDVTSFFAMPARQFAPVSPEVETKTVVKFKSAKK